MFVRLPFWRLMMKRIRPDFAGLIITMALITSCNKLPALPNHETDTPSVQVTPVIATPTPEPLPVFCRDLGPSGMPIGEGAQESHIIYLGWDSGGEARRDQVWVVSIPDGTRKLLLDNLPSPFLGLAFLRDGYHYVLIGGNTIWLSDLDGTPPQVFTSAESFINDFQPYSPIWNLLAHSSGIPEATDAKMGLLHSPDGHNTAIWKAGDPFLRIRNDETGQETQIVETGTLDEVLGNWSPNGDQFVFSYYKNGQDFFSQVYGVNADGTGLHSISRRYELSSLGRPRWSPDGKRVIFPHYIHLDVYFTVLTLSTGEEASFQVNPYRGVTILDQGDIIWSPDSQWVIYDSGWGHLGLDAIDITTGAIYCLTNDSDNTGIYMMDWH